MGMPPVVVGLVVWLLLVRSGPFGGLDLIYTKRAMVLAQFLIALPVTAVLLFLLHLGPLNQPLTRAIFYGIFWAIPASAAIALASQNEARKRRRPSPGPGGERDQSRV
jgi:ABC-type tungstate transport system substrate-binding protein